MDGVKRENQPCKDVQSEGKDESCSRILYKKTGVTWDVMLRLLILQLTTDAVMWLAMQ